MAATSPYVQNDYQAVSNYRGYELPINEIAKAVMAQNQFWNAGASRVKAVKDNALAMNLTLTSNKEMRDKYIKDAEQELVKLSAMNLADPSVQRKGFEIYRPLMKDKRIIYDTQLTDLKQSIVADAEKYKRDEKTKGEGYHIDNLLFALKDFEGFNKDTNPDSLEGIYGKTANASYTPFRDVTKKYLDLLAKCPALDITKNSMQGLYFKHEEDKSKSSAQIANCIKSGLGDQDWQQLLITGTVRYGKNYASLGDGYAKILHGSSLSHAKEAIELKTAMEKYRAAKKLTPELEKEFTDAINSRNSDILKWDGMIGKIKNKDFTDVEKDYDNIVSQVYATQDIKGFADSYQTIKTLDEWRVNSAAVSTMIQTETTNRANTRMLFDAQQNQFKNDIEMLKLLTDKSNPIAASAAFKKSIYARLGIPVPDDYIPMLDKGITTDIDEMTIDALTQSIDDYKTELSNTSDGLYNTLHPLIGKEALDIVLAGGGNRNELLLQEASKYLTTNYKKDKNATKRGELPQGVIEVEYFEKRLNAMIYKSAEYIDIGDKVALLIKNDKPLQEKIAKLDNIAKSITNDVGTAALFLGGNIYFKSLNIDAVNSETKEEIHLVKDDLIQIMKGIHPLYKIRKEKLMTKDGIPLITPERGFWSGFRQSDLEYQGEALVTIQRHLNKRTSLYNDKIAKTADKVVRNSLIYGVGNNEELAEDIKRNLSHIPETTFKNTKIYPTITSEEDGEWVTAFRIKRDASTAEKSGGSQEVIDITDNIIADIEGGRASYNTGFNPIKLGIGVDGKTVLLMRTPNVPMNQPEYQLQKVIENVILANKNLPMKNREKIEGISHPITGGFKIGFDMIGTGGINKVYQAFYKTPDGEKVNEGLETTLGNDLSNQLQALSLSILQLSREYANKK